MARIPTLLLIRGLPGTGKSTFGQQLSDTLEYFHYEADQFFINEDDEYRFDPSKLAEAHAWCQDRTIKALQDNRNVVVTNTFVRQWELDIYRSIANLTNCILIIHTMKKQFKNIHNVPEATIERMRATWED